MAHKHTADELVAAAAKGLKQAGERVLTAQQAVTDAETGLETASRRLQEAKDSVAAYETHVAEKGINLGLSV